MKYVVADMGFEQFRKEIEVRLGRELREPLEVPTRFEASDHSGGEHATTGPTKSAFASRRDGSATTSRTETQVGTATDRATTPRDVLPHRPTGHRD